MFKRIVVAAVLALGLALIVPAVAPEVPWQVTLQACPAGQHEETVERCTGWLWWKRCWYETVCVDNQGGDNIPSGSGSGSGPDGTEDECQTSGCV